MRTTLTSRLFMTLTALFALTTILTLPAPAHAALPSGYLDLADNTTIAGWARDNDYGGPIPVHIYVDGVLFDATFADRYRADVGYHAFHYIHTPFGPGDHIVEVYAIGVLSNGQPDGQNLLIGRRTVTGNCNGYPNPSDVWAWCTLIPSYWVHRQTDTKRLFNNNIMIGIDNSYGGAIMQLYNNDRSKNLVNEHGGGAIQLSLYGVATAPPYNNVASTLCHGLENEPNAWVLRRILNPIQAQGAQCRWEGAGGRVNEPSNDVDHSGAPAPGTWYTRLDDPYNWNRPDVHFPGLRFEQTVELGDVYAKITYKISNGSQVTTEVADQEIPAMHAGYGVNKKLYYTDTNHNVVSRDLTSSNFVYSLTGTEGWWSICDNGTQCITIATKSPDANRLIAKAWQHSGAASPLGRFAIGPNMQKTIVVYLFPYRYDIAINGRTIQQRINALLP